VVQKTLATKEAGRSVDVGAKRSAAGSTVGPAMASTSPYNDAPREKLEGEEVIEAGCTPGWVELTRTASGVYIVSMLADQNPENRWVTGMNGAMMRAWEAVEHHLETEAGDTPAALLTISENPKFFSNGIDPDGQYTKSNELPPATREEQLEGSVIGMSAFFRPLQLPIPTVAAINGHAFGAGMMFAVAHDYRLQREDRGFVRPATTAR